MSGRRIHRAETREEATSVPISGNTVTSSQKR